MPPKKQAKGKADVTANGYTFLDEEIPEGEQLRQLDSIQFVTLSAFKTRRSLREVEQELEEKLPPVINNEHPDAARVKTIQKKDLVERAKFKTYLTEEEAHWKGFRDLEEEKKNQILAKCLKEQILQYEVPLRKEEKKEVEAEDAIFKTAEYVIWLKDFPLNAVELEACNKEGIYPQGYFVIEEFFPPEEKDDMPKFESDDIDFGKKNEEEEGEKEEEKEPELPFAIE